MNRQQHLKLIESMNQLSLDLNKVNQQVHSLVVIPDELEQWYHLLNYIKLSNNSKVDWTVWSKNSDGTKAFKTFNSSNVKSVHYDQEWLVVFDDCQLCLKNIYGIHLGYGYDVQHQVKRAKIATPTPAEPTEPAEPVSQYIETHMCVYPECTLPAVDINHLPEGIKMTQEQFEIVKTFLKLKETFRCAVIKKPTLHLDDACKGLWFIQVMTSCGCYRWYITPEEAKFKVEQNKQLHDTFLSCMEYRACINYSQSQVSQDKIKEFLNLLQTTYRFLMPKDVNAYRPMVKVCRGKNIESFYIKGSYDHETFDTINCLMTEWNEPYDLTREDFDIGFMRHRMFLMYSWTVLTNGWFDTERLPVPSLYYLFKWIFTSQAIEGKFVTDIAGIDLVVEAIKYELEQCKNKTEAVRLMQMCLELIPQYLESDDFGTLERIGYNIKNMLTEWFDAMMSLVCTYELSSWSCDWAEKYLARMLKVYDIRWMLDNFILWSGVRYQFWQRVFCALNIDHFKNMSRDNLALVKRIKANKHSAVDALLKLATAKSHRYISRLTRIQEAGCNIIHDFRLSELAYKSKDQLLIQLIGKTGGKVINKTIDEIVITQDAEMLKLYCLKHSLKAVLNEVWYNFAKYDYDTTQHTDWATDQLYSIDPDTWNDF